MHNDEYIPANQRDTAQHPDDESPVPPPYGETNQKLPTGRPPGLIAVTIVALAGLAGAWLAATSTHDFARHLDGQIHAITCSVLPGAEAALGASGCKDAMLSIYSSIWRDQIWGGIPVALGGLAVFAFIFALAATMAFNPHRTRRDTGFLLLAATVPAITSGVFGWLAANEVGSFCKVCVGMYTSAGVGWLAALVAHLRTPRGEGLLPWGRWALWTVEGVLFVGILGFLWTSQAPADRPGVKGCGTLVAEDTKGLLVPWSKHPGGAEALIVLDPLCPACRAFDRRLTASGLDKRLSAELLLFPLDSTCNWMVKSSLHPGACAVSEAILCSPDKAQDVVAWAFAEQPRLLALGKKDDKALRAAIKAQFPAVDSCLGSARVKAKLNKSLRHAVDNALPVQTPQLFVHKTRLCDEDGDLGLEYTLTRLLAQGGAAPAKGGAR